MLTKRDGIGLRRAFAEACAGQQKLVALTVWDAIDNEKSAGQKLTRTIGDQHDLNPRWDLLETVLASPEAQPLRDYIAQLAQPDPDELMQQTVSGLAAVQVQVEALAEAVQRVAEIRATSPMRTVRHERDVRRQA